MVLWIYSSHARTSCTVGNTGVIFRVFVTSLLSKLQPHLAALRASSRERNQWMRFQSGLRNEVEEEGFRRPRGWTGPAEIRGCSMKPNSILEQVVEKVNFVSFVISFESLFIPSFTTLFFFLWYAEPSLSFSTFPDQLSQFKKIYKSLTSFVGLSILTKLHLRNSAFIIILF